VIGQSQEEQKRMKTCYALKNKGTKSFFSQQCHRTGVQSSSWRVNVLQSLVNPIKHTWTR